MKEQCREQSAAGRTEMEHEKKLPQYEPPKIEMYKEEELLQNVAVLGCSPNPP